MCGCRSSPLASRPGSSRTQGRTRPSSASSSEPWLCGGGEVVDGRPGRQWSLQLADRVLPVAAYWRTNPTMRPIGPLVGVSHSAAHRVIDSLGPLLALASVRRRRADQIAVVDPHPWCRCVITGWAPRRRTTASRRTYEVAIDAD